MRIGRVCQTFSRASREGRCFRRTISDGVECGGALEVVVDDGILVANVGGIDDRIDDWIDDACVICDAVIDLLPVLGDCGVSDLVDVVVVDTRDF